MLYSHSQTNSSDLSAFLSGNPHAPYFLPQSKQKQLAVQESNKESQAEVARKETQKLVVDISQDDINPNTTIVDNVTDINQSSNIHSRFIEDLLSDSD